MMKYVGTRSGLQCGWLNTSHLNSCRRCDDHQVVCGHRPGTADDEFRSALCSVHSRILPEVHYRPHISSPLVPIFSNIYPVARITTNLPQIHFNIILTSTPRSPQRSLSLSFSHYSMNVWIATCVLHVQLVSCVSI